MAGPHAELRCASSGDAPEGPIGVGRAAVLMLVLLLGGLLSLAACESDTATRPERAPASATDIPPTGPSGIEGTVVRGPMCPVFTEENPCPDEPFSALFHVLDTEGNGVAKFLTTAEGWFHLPLAPGDYVIIPDASAPLMDPPSQQVTVVVPRGAFASLTLSFDTGIR